MRLGALLCNALVALSLYVSPVCAQEASTERWELAPDVLRGESESSWSTREALGATFLGFSVVNLGAALGLYASYQDDLNAIQEVSATPGGSYEEYARLRDLITTRERAASTFAFAGLLFGVGSVVCFLLDDPPPPPSAPRSRLERSSVLRADPMPATIVTPSLALRPTHQLRHHVPPLGWSFAQTFRRITEPFAQATRPALR